MGDGHPMSIPFATLDQILIMIVLRSSGGGECTDGSSNEIALLLWSGRG
jgi:hypothetical protein